MAAASDPGEYLQSSDSLVAAARHPVVDLGRSCSGFFKAPLWGQASSLGAGRCFAGAFALIDLHLRRFFQRRTGHHPARLLHAGRLSEYPFDERAEALGLGAGLYFGHPDIRRRRSHRLERGCNRAHRYVDRRIWRRECGESGESAARPPRHHRGGCRYDCLFLYGGLTPVVIDPARAWRSNAIAAMAPTTEKPSKSMNRCWKPASPGLWSIK